MSPLEEFLSRLLHQGRVVFRERPSPEAFAPGRVGELLAEAFASYRLEVAGPLIDFDARVAFEALRLVREACWALVSHEERVEGLGRRLAMSHPPTRASQHLSADLVFRYLPQVHRRARAFDPADPLVALSADVLRQWPLSGVLADLEDGPPLPLGPGRTRGADAALRRAAGESRQAGLAARGPGARVRRAGLPGTGPGPGPRTPGRGRREEVGIMVTEAVAALRREVVDVLKRRFVGRDEVVDLIALAVVAGEHLFLHGPPGTAKSALIRQFADGRAGPVLRVPAHPVLRAQRGLRPDRPGPAPRGDRRHGHDRDAPRGGVRLPRRAVQRQQRDPEQPAVGAQRAGLPPRRRGPSPADAVAVLGVEPPARGRRAARPVRPLPAPLPRGQPPARGDAPAAGGGLGAGAAPSLPSRRSRPPTSASCRVRSTGSTCPGSLDALRRGRVQGARPGHRAVRPPRGQGAEAGGGLGRALRPAGGDGLGPLGPPLRLGPRGADRRRWRRWSPAVLEPHAGDPTAHPLAAVPERVDGEELARQLDAVGAGAPGRPAQPGRRGPAPRARRRPGRPRRLAPRRRDARPSAGRTAKLLERLG